MCVQQLDMVVQFVIIASTVLLVCMDVDWDQSPLSLIH